jgi:hypothetical protein
MKVSTNAKLAIRTAILTAGLVAAFMASSAKPVPAADGGPILVCPPHDKSCKPNLPVADGGPILVCPPHDKSCKPNLPVADGGPILVCPPHDKSCKPNLPVVS